MIPIKIILRVNCLKYGWNLINTGELTYMYPKLVVSKFFHEFIVYLLCLGVMFFKFLNVLCLQNKFVLTKRVHLCKHQKQLSKCYNCNTTRTFCAWATTWQALRTCLSFKNQFDFGLIYITLYQIKTRTNFSQLEHSNKKNSIKRYLLNYFLIETTTIYTLIKSMTAQRLLH